MAQYVQVEKGRWVNTAHIVEIITKVDQLAEGKYNLIIDLARASRVIVNGLSLEEITKIRNDLLGEDPSILNTQMTFDPKELNFYKGTTLTKAEGVKK